MRFCSSVVRWAIAGRLALFLGVGLVAGCQTTQPGIGYRLMAHAALVDSSGLTPPMEMPDLKVRAALPHGWEQMDTDSTALYMHQQWRSPTHATGIGVAYIHMPLPMSAKMLVWFAKGQYSRMTAKQHKPEGQLQGEWTDSLGREWFEGENDKFHVKGYVVTDGFDAWAVYSGYRLKFPPNQAEISLAYRGMDSIVPLPLEPQSFPATPLPQAEPHTRPHTGLAASAASDYP